MIISRTDTRRSVLYSLFSSSSDGECHHPEVSDFPDDEVSGCLDLHRLVVMISVGINHSQPGLIMRDVGHGLSLHSRSRPIILSPLVRLETRQRHNIRGWHHTFIWSPEVTSFWHIWLSFSSQLWMQWLGVFVRLWLSRKIEIWRLTLSKNTMF